MSHDFIAYLQELFADFGEVSARAMFGGYGLYHDGVLIGVVMDDGLYLKVDAETQALFEAEGCAPFVYTQTDQAADDELLVGAGGGAGFAGRRCCRGRGSRMRRRCASPKPPKRVSKRRRRKRRHRRVDDGRAGLNPPSPTGDEGTRSRHDR